MKIYENDRTNQIVARLVTLGNTQRPIVIISWIIFLGYLFSFFGTLYLDRQLWWLGGMLGVILGYALGLYIASLLTVVFEWMAQLLIAQGEIIAALSKH
jgi:hypothetical protein